MDRTIVICKMLELEKKGSYGFSLDAKKEGLRIGYYNENILHDGKMEEIESSFIIKMDIEKSMSVIKGLSDVELLLKNTRY